MSSKPKLVRITTVPHSLHLLLKGQMKYMSENGYEVVMMSSGGPEISEVVDREGCEWIEVPLSREFNVWSDIKALFYIIRVFRKIRPDIVHSHSPKAGTVGQLAAWLCRVPLRIHTVAGLPLVEYTGTKRKILDFVEKITYRCSHWVLPNSAVQGKYLVENGYVNPKKVQTLGRGSSNGIDLEYFNPTPELQAEANAWAQSVGIGERDKVLNFVGRLTNYKGVIELVKAFVQLQQEFSKLHLVLIGPFEELNPLPPEIQKEIESNPNIHTTGHVDDVRPYLLVGDIFVFPSYREGFPQSLMQASAMGLPCIASDINGCNEIIEDGVNGFLVPPKTVEPIVDKVSRLLKEEKLYQEHRQNAGSIMREFFEQKAFWNRIVQFYREKSNLK